MEPFCKTDRPGLPTVFVLEGWMRRFDFLEAGVSSRLGGVSLAPYASLNCGLHVHDRAEHVVENRRRLARATRLPFEAWTYAEQVHGRRVAVVTRRERGAGRESRSQALQDTDAFVTNEPDIALCALFADCVPIYLFDPDHRAVGLAHAGWKGTVQKIAMDTIDTMTQTFGSRPDRMLAAIGPSIGSCCYEVDERVIREVDAVLRELSLAVQDGRPESGAVYSSRNNGKFMLDLQQLNRQIMIKAGILPSNIEISRLCTGCHTEWFFSHRKEAGTTGRMAAWIGMVSS